MTNLRDGGTVYLTITGAPKLRGFPYFWVKAVKGFDPKHHCAKCLRGRFLHVTADGWRMNEPKALALQPGEVGYLCGVSTKGYAQNLHVPFRFEPREMVRGTLWQGDEFLLENARQLPIPALPDGWAGLDRKFTTCRNFQFAASFFGSSEEKVRAAWSSTRTPLLV